MLKLNDYVCVQCGTKFEELEDTSNPGEIQCPACLSYKVEQVPNFGGIQGKVQHKTFKPKKAKK